MAPDLISVQEAKGRVLDAVSRLPLERIAIDDALDRVLAEDVHSTGDVPPFACSAMDGYALSAGPAGRRLRVIGESRAGTPAAAVAGEHAAIRISTGAALPRGATAVLRQEDADLDRDQLVTRAPVALGENIRRAGEDQRAGQAVLTAGTQLGIAELGAAVGAGAAELSVVRRPRVAVLCTGDELRAAGESLGPGEIHNSNAPMLSALAVRSGAVVTPAERVRDDRQATEGALARALEHADVVIVSGGVSVGPHDHVKPALHELGVSERFWGVALQPGKPTWFGTRAEKLVFGLPGNPVSAVVTFTLFVTPALALLQGRAPSERHAAGSAELASAVARNARREQALRVRITRADGRVLAEPNGPQGSHLISSLLGADALAMIPAGDGSLEPGTVVQLVSLPR